MKRKIRTILSIALLGAALLGVGGCAGNAGAPYSQSGVQDQYRPPVYGPQTHGYYDPYLYPYGFRTY